MKPGNLKISPTRFDAATPELLRVLCVADRFEIFDLDLVLTQQLVKICPALARKFRRLARFAAAKLEQSDQVVFFKLIPRIPVGLYRSVNFNA
jgi:hypothetical protein